MLLLLTYKFRFVAASIGCLFLICQLHIIAKLIHHLHESLINDLLPALGDTDHLRVSRQTVSIWLDTSIWMSAALDVRGNKST